MTQTLIPYKYYEFIHIIITDIITKLGFEYHMEQVEDSVYEEIEDIVVSKNGKEIMRIRAFINKECTDVFCDPVSFIIQII